jgi:plastocyanin
MKLLRVFLFMGASLLLLGAVAACSDDDDDSDGGGEEPAATTPAPDGDGDGVTVEAKDNSFDPETFSVTAGEEATVTLENAGNASHTLTVYSDENFENAVDGADTETVNGGDSGEFTATFDAGDYYFRCEIHPAQMKGTFEAE